MVSQTERQQAIVALLAPTGAVSVGDLAEHFQVTTETVRRDLRIMESLGLLQRVHGGAIVPEPMGTSPPLLKPALVEGLPPEPQMLELAEVAVSLIPPTARSIFLDSGLACLAIATVVGDPPEDARWTVVTSSPGAVIALSSTDAAAAVILNGQVHGKSSSIIGPTAVDMISQLRADIAFVEVDAIQSDTGLCTFCPETIPIKQAMIKNAAFTVAVLSPRSHHDQQQHRLKHRFATLAEFDALVTDDNMLDFPVLPDHNFQVVTP
ncbi:DeoR family transcriptional regulator [Corynebacterium suranareeae]|uniref:Lactose phosphotransferase system repressor n=1 Tax=Corynebacterium suranareeae TaxID=2506452 RepID=A0A160PQA7_9CORY|nr:DeoR/GlpR family DNA-binding transcription regulator [Corynebacterium suranareeae]BAU96267.1 DeoR family transcriptional regulator [Corynebacterium suranareeae]